MYVALGKMYILMSKMTQIFLRKNYIFTTFNLLIASNLNHDSSCNCNNTSSSESHSLVSVNNGEAEGGSNKVADPVDPAAHQTDPEGRPGDPADPASAGVLSPHHSKPGTAATSDKKRPTFR